MPRHASTWTVLPGARHEGLPKSPQGRRGSGQRDRDDVRMPPGSWACPRRPPPRLALACGLLLSASALAAPVQFNPVFLEDSSIDLSRFSRQDYLVPSDYPVDLMVNQSPRGRHLLRVEDLPDHRQQLSLSMDSWRTLDLQPEIVERMQDSCATRASQDCFLPASAPGVVLSLDRGALVAHLSVPQALLERQPRGRVDIDRWKPGETALLANYHLNGYRSSIDGEHYDSTFVGVSLAANLGLWQYRSGFNASRNDNGEVDWDSLHHYLQHPLADQGKLLRLGEVNTRGDFFDSLPVLGMTLYSEPRMLPDSQRGYAPVVRGTARTQARVTITQQGRRLLQTSVAPGPFVIDDLYPTGYGGDLEVTISEADGRVERYRVPYAALPGLLRPGHSRTSLAVGRLNRDSLENPPLLGEIGYRRGVNNALTAYTGLQVSEHYVSPLIGGAFNTPLGAVALDAHYSRATLPDEVSSGWSLEASYSRHLQPTNTDINLAAYRYSSSGYLSLSDAAYRRDPSDHTEHEPDDETSTGASLDAHQRNRLQFNVSQPLGDRTRLSFTGSMADYWHRDGSEATYQLGLTQTIGRASLSLSMSLTENDHDDSEHRALVSLSLPLTHATFGPRLGVSASRDSEHHQDATINVTGNLGAERELSYGIQANRSRGDDGHHQTWGLNLASGTSVGHWTLSGSASDDYRQMALGASGAVLLHRHGVTLGQNTGDTVGLVRAEGGAGAHVANTANLTLDSDGEALVPFLSPYRLNEVQLDPRGASARVDFHRTSVSVAPYAGAMVPIDFATDTGQPVVVVLRQQGRGVPLGAQVSTADGRVLGQVGAGGMLLLRDLAKRALLFADLGKGLGCWARPDWTPPAIASSEIPIVETECGPVPPDNTEDFSG